MEDKKQEAREIHNHFAEGSNPQVFNGPISGAIFAMPGSTVNQYAAPMPPEGNDAKEQGKPTADRHERNEERFHFVHPEIDDDEAWRIHDALKRLVAHQKVPEICAYLKELRQKGKIMLPPNSTVMYNELARLGMPTGNGFSEKHFSNSYTK